MKPTIFIASLSLVVFVGAKPAYAEIDAKTRDVMRGFINDAGALYEQGKYEEARAKWMMAFGIVKIPTIAVWAARANDKLGKLSAAAELYESALVMQPNELWIGDAQKKAQKEARSELEALSKRIPSVKFEISGGDPSTVEVTVDGSKLDRAAVTGSRSLDPGQHFVTAVQSGRTVSVSVTLAEGENKTVPLRFDDAGTGSGAVPAKATADTTSTEPQAPNQPPSIAATSPRSSNQALTIATWSALGVGAAGVVLGTVAGVVAIGKRSDLMDAGCTKTECYDLSLQSQLDSYRTWRTVSMVSYIVGAVGTAAGVTLLIVKPKQESGPTVSLVVAPGAVTASGRF